MRKNKSDSVAANIQFLKKVEKRLATRRVPAARFEAETLVRHFGSANRIDFFTGKKALSSSTKNAIRRAVASRLRGTPLGYVLKETEFCGHKFFISKDTLIPRPETELLVEEAVRILENEYKCHSRESGNQPDPRLKHSGMTFDWSDPRFRGDDRNTAAVEAYPKILDLGTGSGCIAVSLTLAVPACRMTAVDISKKALKSARKNIDFHGLAEKISLLESDLFSVFSGEKKDFWDIIVSNPPYVSEEDFPGLPREVLSEPRLALDGGRRGLKVVEAILNDAPFFLKQGGWLLMEIGKGQSKPLHDKILKEGVFRNFRFVKDYAGIDRILAAQKI